MNRETLRHKLDFFERETGKTDPAFLTCYDCKEWQRCEWAFEAGNTNDACMSEESGGRSRNLSARWSD